MKLWMLPASPFVRKVRVAARELGLQDRLEEIPVDTSPMNSDPEVVAANPLGRVPTLKPHDGAPIYESGVIVEYLDSLAPEPTLVPLDGPRRWPSRRLHALADGLAQEGVTLRREATRPAELQWSAVFDAFGDKLARTYDYLEAEPDLFEGTLDVGQIALATTLAWLTFRDVGPPIFENRPHLRTWYDRFTQRPSMHETAPY